jgi:serine/threonine protein kinase
VSFTFLLETTPGGFCDNVSVMVGQTIGKYRVLDRIGRGGMGTVYRALDETLHRDVAIKVLNAELNDPEVAKRFRAEAITVARLSHPGIATIYELFQHEGQWLMVMEFVRGETLEHMVDRMGACSPQRSAELCMQALAALAHAHSMGVVHRDLKPANMMITETGAVKIMDFGIARVAGTEHLTNAGFMMGTPAYMAPEQVRGEELDARADLYSMGVVFYRLTTAKLPFKGETPFAMAQSQVNDPPTPVGMVRSDLPPWVEPVVARSLAKRPEERFQSAAEFHEAFARCLAGLPFTTMYGANAQTELLMTPSRAMPTGSLSMRGFGTGSLPTVLGPSPAPSGPQPIPATLSSGAVVSGPILDPAAASVGPGTAPGTVPPGVAPAGVPSTQSPIAGPASAAAAAGAAQKAAAKTATGQKPNPNKRNATVLIGAAVGLVLIAAVSLIVWKNRQNAVVAAPPIVTEPLPVPAPEPPPPTTAIVDPAPTTPVPDPAAPTGVPPGTPPPPTGTKATTTPGTSPPGPGTPTSGTTPGRGTKGGTTTVPPTNTIVPPPVTITPAPVAPAPPQPSTAPPPSSTPADPPANDPLVSFPDVKIYAVSGRNTSGRDVDLQFAAGQLTVLPSAGGAAFGSINYKTIAKATYTKARDPKWDPALPSPPQNLDVGSAFRLSGHWLVLQTETGFTILRLEDNNFARIIGTLEARAGIKVDRRTSTDK